MTGSAANLRHGKQNGILVAVKTNGMNLLNVAAGFALVPELLTAAAPVMGLACFMYASISTSPSLLSCAMAGISPLLKSGLKSLLGSIVYPPEKTSPRWARKN